MSLLNFFTRLNLSTLLRSFCDHLEFQAHFEQVWSLVFTPIRRIFSSEEQELFISLEIMLHAVSALFISIRSFDFAMLRVTFVEFIES